MVKLFIISLLFTLLQMSYAQDSSVDNQPGSILSTGTVFTTVNETPIVFPATVDSLFFRAGGQKSAHITLNENGDPISYREALNEPYCAITRKNKKDNQLISKDRKVQVSSTSVHSAACIRVNDIKSSSSFLCIKEADRHNNSGYHYDCEQYYSNVFLEGSVSCSHYREENPTTNSTVTKIHFDQNDKTFIDLECYQKNRLARELTVGEIKKILEGTFSISIPAIKPASITSEIDSDRHPAVGDGSPMKTKEVNTNQKQGLVKKETSHKELVK